MSPMVKVLDTGRKSAEENMALDGQLLKDLDANGEVVLHLYEWEGKAATYGYFVDIEEFIDLKAAERHGVSFAKRPTGGGIIFHIWDLAFSVLVPSGHPAFSQNTLINYQRINQVVLEAAQKMYTQALSLIPASVVSNDQASNRFCMASPTIYDVVIGDKKIAGAAQRKRKNGYLHQGTISLQAPDEALLKELLLPGSKVLEAMKEISLPLLGQGETLEEGRQRMKEQLTKGFHENSHFSN